MARFNPEQILLTKQGSRRGGKDRLAAIPDTALRQPDTSGEHVAKNGI